MNSPNQILDELLLIQGRLVRLRREAVNMRDCIIDFSAQERYDLDKYISLLERQLQQLTKELDDHGADGRAKEGTGRNSG